MTSVRLILLPIIAAGAVSIAGLTAAPASADCVSSAGTTLCSQGDSRGANTGAGPGSLNTGPYWPYPCEYDWYCGDGGFNITFGGWGF